MAGPSNKKSGESYLQSFTKEKLIAKYIDLASHNTELEKDKANLEEEILSLKKKVELLQKKVEKFNTKDEIIKKILEYRARNYPPIIIRDKLKLEGIDQTLASIKNIINTPLNPEMELYYNKCIQEVAESVSIKTGLYNQSDIEEIQRLIDSAYEDLYNCDPEDIKTRDYLRNSISGYIKRRVELMKNIDEKSTPTEEEEVLNETMENFKEFSNNVYNFAILGTVEKIGGENEK